MKKVKFIAKRTNENVIAIISCESKHTDVNVIVSNIRKAIMSWTKEDEEGEKALNYSCNEFNFGDLAMYQDDETLPSYLEREGVLNLNVELLNCLETVNFDTILC